MYRIIVGENPPYYMETLSYIKYQEKNNINIMCYNPEEAQGILSPDSSMIYALPGKGLEEKYQVAYVTEIDGNAYLLWQQKRMEELEATQKALLGVE